MCYAPITNNGDTEMVILVVTDCGLTGRAYVGDYNKTARMKNATEVARNHLII